MSTETRPSARLLGGRYRVGQLLGRGGMADVFDGVDERLGRPVAVKVLRSQLLSRPEVRARFEQEARSAARLSHPNVVAVYDTGEDEDGTPYFVMERLPGETLADRLADGPQDPQWVVRMAGDVLGALAAAHAAGIVHRDVKPGNILVSEDGCAKVADFGIAKTAEEAAGGDTTATGMLLGTPAYLAPERIDGRPATPQSDLYSLGVVLYEALAGAKPFAGDTPVAVANAIRHDDPQPLTWLRPGIDPGLVAAVERAMSKDPSRRFTDAGDMAAALGVLPAASGGGGAMVDGDATSLMAVSGSGDATSVVEAAPAPAIAARRDVRQGRSIFPVFPLLAGAVVVLAILLLAASGNQGDGGDGVDRSSLASRLRDLSERVKTGDGPRGPELSERLDQVADEVEAGGGSDSATRLLADVTAWHQQRQIFDKAADEATTVLLQVPGVQPPPATVAPAAQPQPPPPADKDHDGGRKGKGKKGDGD